MKKTLSVISALLSLCLLVTPAFAAEPADDGPVIFSFEAFYVGEADRSSTPAPAPSRQRETITAPKIEESSEPFTPEVPAAPSSEPEEELPSWISGYIHDPSGFDYPEIDAKAFVDEIFRLANEERVKAGLPEMERREDVAPVAVIRAKELSELFSHTRPNGESYMSLMDEYGIEYRWAGENGAKVPATSGPSKMMTGWMNSEGHRNNILSSKYTGMEISVYQVGQMVYCSQMFVY